MSHRRGQLVLAAAVVVALAFVPMLAAYLQLGYDADAEHRLVAGDAGGDARRYLDRATTDVSVSVAGDHAWRNRETAGQRIDERLREAMRRLEGDGPSSVAYEVAYNASAADRHASQRCPSGPNREFGACETRVGIVMQERAGEVHLLAAAFDVRVLRERDRTEMTVVVSA